MEKAAIILPEVTAAPAADILVKSLEAFLGDPYQPELPTSFKRSMELDEAEAYPEQFLALLDAWGLNRYYIPRAYGGKLTTIEESFALMRSVARRDLTVAIAHGNVFLGTTPIWIAGSPDLKKHVAERVKANYKIALGLSEKAHGSDLLDGEVTATQTPEGYLIQGEKWLVNYSCLGDAITVLTRTSAEGGPRGFSLFYVEKNETNDQALSYAGKIKTLGVRGLDMNAIRFNQCRLPASGLIHTLGGGLEVIIKSLQITRAMCAAFSLGAIDTAFRTVVQFARSRQLYHGTIIGLPILREKLSGVLADILICECLSTAANRALHIIPGQFSVLSAVVKSFIPPAVEKAMAELSTLLGARYYLREEYHWGIFQKCLRDQATISLFDGNTMVNLQALIQQLRLLTGLRQKAFDRQAPVAREVLAGVYSREQELPELDLNKLDIFNKGKDDLLYGLRLGYDKLALIAAAAPADQEKINGLLRFVEMLLADLQELDQAVMQVEAPAGNTYLIPAELYHHAEKYCLLHAAAACLNTWLYNKDTTAGNAFLSNGTWLYFSLRKILLLLGHPSIPVPLAWEDEMVDQALRLVQNNQSISLFPVSFGQEQ